MTTISSPILIVGAGISGLSAALLLARAGQRVRIIERSARIGGLAGAETFRGIPCDIGSHRLHPAALDVALFREMHAHESFLTRPRQGVLLFQGRRLSYPPSAFAMLEALGLRTGLSLASAALASSFRGRAMGQWETQRVSRDDADDIGFERFVIERVGEPAYHAFYRPYALKVWGIDPAELSQSVAKKRLSATQPWALVKELAGRLGAYGQRSSAATESLGSFIYPARGMSSLLDYLEAELRDRGISVECGTSYDPRALREGPVLFAGELRDLVPTSLEVRGLYLVYVALPVARVGEHETYYAPDPTYWFGRVSELQHYSPVLSRAGETILCVEIPEGVWGRGMDFSTGTRFQTLLQQLRHAGIVPPGVSPLEVRQTFVPQVYPLYRRGFRRVWRDAMRQIVRLGSVFPFGRQALFLHCNVDHCVAIAEDVVRHLLEGRDAAAWVEKAETYLELRVRD